MRSPKEVKLVIRRAEFRGQSLMGRFNKDVLCNLVELLVRLVPNRIDQVCFTHPGNQPWVAEDPHTPAWSDSGWPRRIAGTKWWIYTNLDTTDIQHRAEWLVRFFGFSSTDLLLTIEHCDRFGRAA